MVRLMSVVFVGLLGLTLIGGALADDKKAEKELKGQACCAKCELKDKNYPKCQTVLLVKEAGKEVRYYFDKDSETKYHKTYCTGKTDVTVKAKVTEKDGKKWLSITSITKS